MTGLLHTFCRHFVVLTNFMENEVKSRRSDPLAQSPAREGLQAPTGPGGWVGGLGDPGNGPVRPAFITHPLRPCRAYGTRFAGYGSLLEQLDLVAGYPVLPTRYTHPYTPSPVPA